MGQPEGENLDPIPLRGFNLTAETAPIHPAPRILRRLMIPLLLLLAGALLLVNELSTSDLKVEGGFTMGGDEIPPPGWGRGTVGPLRSRMGHGSVWTGSELVIWGGEPDGDGAAYDPVTGGWRKIAPAPFPTRVAAATGWTGFEVILWGGESQGPQAIPLDTGAAYDVVADRWRLLPPAPLSPRVPLTGVWTTQEFVVLGGTSPQTGPRVDAAAYDPRTDSWRDITPLPVAFSHAVGVWTGQELVVFGTPDEGPNSSVAVAWHPTTDEWRRLPRSPLTGRRVTAVWTGRKLLAWDSDLHSAALELTSARWRPLPDIPSIPGLCDPVGVLAGEVVFAEQCGRGALFSLAGETWRSVPHPYFLSGQPVWTGRHVMLWSGAFRGSKDSIWLYKPA